MAISLEHLLPAPEESVRCAEHARSIGVDPGGTAIEADRVVVIATPAPWPKPALAHPFLVPAVEVFQSSPVPTRVLACTAEPDGLGTVVVYERSGHAAVERVYEVPPGDAAALGLLAETIVATDGPAGNGRSPTVGVGRRSLTGSGRAGARMVVPPGMHPVALYDPARPALLICTQGSHDVCCGADGARLAEAIDAATDRIPPVRVLRVSHTGGHRFAPTAMSMPDGRMWAGLDLDAVVTILDPDGDLRPLAPRCRGWWGAGTGQPQVAERAVLAAIGRELDGLDRVVAAEAGSPTPAFGDEVARYRVSAADRTWLVDVAPGRQVPTIACRQLGGQPIKTGLEYAVVSVEAI